MMRLHSLVSFLFSGLILTVFAAPEIRYVSPHAGVPGRRTILTFTGSNLQHATNLWTSFGGTAQPVANTNSGQVSFAVNCPPDSSGVQALQVFGPDGASGFQLILVDALKTTPHQENHHSLATALKIHPPVAVDCILKTEKADHYKFAAKAGEHFSIEVLAHRIGSQMDPVARVLDQEGREIAFCDDEGGVWNDARFPFTAPAEGEYTIAVHDVGYGGGNAFDYRLRVTSEPLVWFTFPLADPADRGAEFERIGSRATLPVAQSPANPSPAPMLASTPQIVESEPNDTLSSTPPVAAPIILHGKMESKTDLDRFPFVANQDQKLLFQSQTRTLGSPCDLALLIRNAEGKTIAQSDGSASGDAALTNKFPAAGIYTLEVRELSGSGASNAPYRIKVQEFVPGFSLRSDKNVLNLKAGESTKLKVIASRYEFDGPIELRLDPNIPGVTLDGNVIPEKKNETELTIQASGDAPTGVLHHIKIIGKDGDRFTAPASTRPALQAAFPLLLNPPPVLDGIVTLVVTSPSGP